jgi:hypothetical protein
MLDGKVNNVMMNDDKRFLRIVDEVVHYIWDPIKICGIPQTRNEYDGYVNQIYARTKAGDMEELINYLKWATEDRMGLVCDDKKNKEVADILFEWKSYIYDK